MALTDNLISYYKLDESSGNAADSVGSNTLTNTSTSYSAGKINNCASFNGSSSKLVSGNSAIAAFTSLSFGGWVYINSDNVTIFNQIFEYTGNYRHYRIYYTPVGGGYGRIYLQEMEGNGSYWAVISSDILSSSIVGSWHHIIGTVTNGSQVIYVDGASSNTGTNTMHPPSNTSLISLGYDSNFGNYYSSKVDEFGVWNRILTSGEVSSLYNGGSGLQYPFTPTSNIKSINGVAYANIKSVNGVAISNIKSINNLS